MVERLIFHDWHHAFDNGFEKTEKQLGLTKKQREWIIRAWDRVFDAPEGYHVCGFPIIKDEKFYLHGFVEKVQIHHIVPRGWASKVLGWNRNQINNPFNLIPLCPYHHTAFKQLQLDYLNEVVSAIHPDIEVARKNYKGKEHPTTYDFAFENGEEMMARREPYWNTDWDMALLRKAEEVYYKYLNWQLKNWGEYRDLFPVRK